MSKEDLIPIRTTERAKELGRKGGKANTKAKAMANSVKNLKHGKYSKYFKPGAVEFVKNPDLFAEMAMSHLMEMKDMDIVLKNPAFKIAVQRAINDTFKTIHGTRQKVEIEGEFELIRKIDMVIAKPAEENQDPEKSDEEAKPKMESVAEE